jgi:hypothetical protein
LFDGPQTLDHCLTDLAFIGMAEARHRADVLIGAPPCTGRRRLTGVNFYRALSAREAICCPRQASDQNLKAAAIAATALLEF